MKTILLFLALLNFVHANDVVDKKFGNFELAVAGFEEAANVYGSNVYFFQDNEKTYHVSYDENSTAEVENSFLQIYSSVLVDDALTRYRQIQDKTDLYVKKFNKLYFLRLTDKNPVRTQEAFMRLREKYPDIYRSQALRLVKKPEPKRSEHKITFIKDKQEKIQTDVVSNVVFSLSSEVVLPSMKADKILRNGNLEKIEDLKSYAANFAIVRGDVLGMKNAGLYGFEAFTNYGILSETAPDILYLVSKEEIASVYDLRQKSISVGNISDIAQVYLNDVIKESGVGLDINFKSLSLEDSIKKVREGELDAFFIFAPMSKVTEIANGGLYVSTTPDDFLKVLNKKQGLESVKYKIDDRIVTSYKSPNFLVAIVQTLDVAFAAKIKEVVLAFECYKNVKIPDPFYGNVHPELQNAILSILADANAQKLLDAKDEAISISFYKESKQEKGKLYYYQIENVSSDDVNLSFENMKTKAFDNYAFKPRHLLKLQMRDTVIEMRAKSKKLISFAYSNPFATRVEDMNIELNFKETRENGKHFSIGLKVGDK